MRRTPSDSLPAAGVSQWWLVARRSPLRSSRRRACDPLGQQILPMIPDFESQPSEGLVILLVEIDDEDRREQVIHRIVNLPSEQITETLYEITTGDWDEGLWDEELDWFSELLFGDDRLVVWRFTDGSFSRFTLTADD